MKRFTASLLLAAALPLAAHAAAVNAPVLPARIASAAQAQIDNGVYTAMVIAVVDGDRSQIATFGKRADGRAVDADTLFEIGSVTKTFTGMLLARAVEGDAALSLDTPVAKLLPGYRIPSRDGKPITLGLLAEQYSGLPRVPDNLNPSDAANPYADYGSEQLKAFLAGYALPRDPGAAYEYSNLGFGLLGDALAAHAGLSYGQLLSREVLDPLGMHDSGVDLTPTRRARLVPGHDGNGKRVPHWDFGALPGAGAILSSGADMLRYLQVNMGRGASPLSAAARMAQKPRREFGHGGHIGLAWMTSPRPGGTVIWHNGETGGYASFIGFTADRQHGVVILSNAAVVPQALGFATLLPDAPLPKVHKRVTLPTAQLDQYVGRYRFSSPTFYLTVVRSGDQLYAQATGQDAFPLYASAVDEFFAHVSGIAISFERGAGGKVDALVLHQDGDHRASRVIANSPMALTPAQLQAYVGHYALAPGLDFTVSAKDNQLLVQLTGQPAMPVYASALDHFYYTMVDAKIDFERDAKGQVTALVLHQNGASHHAPRKP